MKLHSFTQFLNEAKGTPVTQDQWDIEWKTHKVFGKEFDEHMAKRIAAGMSVAKSEEQAEDWAYKNWKQLPGKAKKMTYDE